MEAALAFMIAFAALSSANGVRDTEAAGLFFGQRHKPAFADALDTDIDLPVDRRQLQSTDGACDAGVHDYLKGDKASTRSEPPVLSAFTNKHAPLGKDQVSFQWSSGMRCWRTLLGSIKNQFNSPRPLAACNEH